MASPQQPWWSGGVLYQAYPRSFADSNDDGVGDIIGLCGRLEYLHWLGVDGIWLNPTFPSPNRDWGYDVSDYFDVHPDLGTLADIDALIAAAGELGIRILLDLVPAHTSDRHQWFTESRSSTSSARRPWYIWRDEAEEQESVFGGEAWTYDEQTGQYYHHLFLPEQPDLNWMQPEVRDAFDEILRFWFDRGVAGFRIDVCHSIIKDRDLRDNPPATKDDHWWVQMSGLRSVYNSSRPEVHDVLRRWRVLADGYDPHRVLIGETYVFDPVDLGSFYGDDDELNLAFNFTLLHSKLQAPALRAAIEQAEQHLPADAWPVWTGGNHDNHRFASRWCEDDPAKIRAAMVMLMGLRGTPFLYYGDEIGMPDTDIPDDRVLDPVGVFHGARVGRDPERTPMPWTGEPGAGYTDAGVEPWLPFGDVAACNVADQRHDPDSMLSLTRDLIGLRNAMPELRRGSYTTLPSSDGRVWAWLRGERTVVAMNCSDDALDVSDAGAGTIRISTIRARDGERVSGSLHLDPWEAAIVWRDA